MARFTTISEISLHIYIPFSERLRRQTSYHDYDGCNKSVAGQVLFMSYPLTVPKIPNRSWNPVRLTRRTWAAGVCTMRWLNLKISSGLNPELLELMQGAILSVSRSYLTVFMLPSIWIHECQAAFFNPRHSQMGENPELHTLFYRLADLLRMCIIPVFIFDGLSHPAKKRGKNVVTQPHWLTDRFKEFIDAFGFYSYTVSV